MNEINIVINIPVIVLFSITLLTTGVCLFFIGYFIGKQNNTGVSNNVVSNKPTSFFDNNTNTVQKPKAITIDDSKFVTEIRTDNLEKKYTQLGEVKQSEEDISGSINKLKNMKR